MNNRGDMGHVDVVESQKKSRVQISSYKGRAVDALGQKADEGRGKRRYASGSCNQALIRGFPNGVTRTGDEPVHSRLNT